MSDLNESQRRIVETTEGMMVVDAGPGTGKTHTIAQRYIRLVSTGEVKPEEVLLLTFTRNAAAEMEERIVRTMSASEDTRDLSKRVRVQTFDAFCLSVNMAAPDSAGAMFGFRERPTHSVKVVENETLNLTHFRRFLDGFLESSGGQYGDWGAIASQDRDDLFDLVNRLMARGIVPLADGGWFGGDGGKELVGDTDRLLRALTKANSVRNKINRVRDVFKLGESDPKFDPLPYALPDRYVPDELLTDAAGEDRSELIRFVHDVYWHYVDQSVSEDRMTFGINALLAFSVLYSNPDVRSLNSYRYVMVDEFQDTNASQLMLSLLVLREPNLCVVGDWKQGIYGFRFVSINNITHFEKRVKALRDALNEDAERVAFEIPKALELHLDRNYRSSQLIFETAKRALFIPCNDEEEDIDFKAALNGKVKDLTCERNGEIGGFTEVRCVKVDSNDLEARAVVDCVCEYVSSEKYRIVENTDGGTAARPVRYGDIAVFCRNGRDCRAVVRELNRSGVPAFLYGDQDVMSTREGKLALAWMRYVDNERDPWGLMPIMADLGYPLTDCLTVRRRGRGPADVEKLRKNLHAKRRRVNEMLTTMYEWYGLDNDVTQAIINVLSKTHGDSLMSISDLVSLLDEDISSDGSTYPVDQDLGADAVSVMTMHKSKGLEFPVVVLPYMDSGKMPSTRGDNSVFRFNSIEGVRCSKTVARYGDYSKICPSWRSAVTKAAFPKNYDEERRLMFVAVSRAKQYVTMISGNKPSRFVKDDELRNGPYAQIGPHPAPGESESETVIQPPNVSGYSRRMRNVGVHSVMRIDTSEGGDDFCSKGREYGTAVHEEAALMQKGLPPSEKYPEAENVRKVLDRASDALRSYSEVDCTLPAGDVNLKGTIDLLMVFDDRVEVHDYKTDETERFQPEYELQLSIYAHAATGFHRGLPVRCFIDYVSLGRTVEFEPMALDDVLRVVSDRLADKKRF